VVARGEVQHPMEWLVGEGDLASWRRFGHEDLHE